MSLASSAGLPNPTLMIGWLPQEGAADPNRGLYVLEDPTPAQLQVFESANFPYKTNPYFAPPELMEEAGAERYIHFRDSPAVMEWTSRGRNADDEEEPPLLLSFADGIGGYVLRYPTKEQRKIFEDAGVDYRLRALGGIPKDLMEKAGATYHTDISKVPEFVGLTFSRPSDEWNYKRYMDSAILGHPNTGGIWVLEKPSWEQIEALKEGGYEFWNYDINDKYHSLLESVGAKFYEDPEEVRHIIDTVSPGGPGDVKEGERGGRVKKSA
jgi:hypothetical protein